MRKLFIFATVFLSSCQTFGPNDINVSFEDWDNAEPGTVVHQSSTKLGNGFYDVTKSIVNSAGHWEGVGHFGYIYHNKNKICQCGKFDTVISPNGKYIVYYSNQNDALELYNTDSKEVTVLQDEYMGYPETAEWSLESNEVTIYLSDSNRPKNEALTISLD
jgi:hypothetical protein